MVVVQAKKKAINRLTGVKKGGGGHGERGEAKETMGSNMNEASTACPARLPSLSLSLSLSASRLHYYPPSYYYVDDAGAAESR